jgi:hypothetical protein
MEKDMVMEYGSLVKITATHIKDSINKIIKTVMVCISGQMEQFTKENFKMI